MGARWYYPKVGEFLSSDPAAGSANPRMPNTGLRWVYAQESPIDQSDPTGRCITDSCYAAADADHISTTSMADAVQYKQQVFLDTHDESRRPLATRSGQAQPKVQPHQQWACGRFGCIKEGPSTGPSAADVMQFVKDVGIGFGKAALATIESTPPIGPILGVGTFLFDPNNPDRKELSIFWNDGKPSWDSYQRATDYRLGVDQDAIVSTVKNYERHPGQLVGTLLFIVATGAVLHSVANPGVDAATATAVQTTTKGPDFVVAPNGTTVIVPTGATGPYPALTGKGFRYLGGSGGNGLSSRVANVRIMDPTSRYPDGYVNYTNANDQSVNPYTGQTISKGDPWWHGSL